MRNLGSILFINGKVKFPITIDPLVWIFDDRKVEIDTYFHKEIEKVDEIEDYTKKAAQFWQKEIQEGAIMPPTLKSERKFKKVELITGSFGIPFKSFIENAEPEEGAVEVIVTANGKELSFPIGEAKKFFIGFSKDGKPLKLEEEGGPIHIYFGDGSNLDNPIKNVQSFTVK